MALFPFTATMACMYCIGSFCSASWDLSEWTESLRAVMAVWGVVFGFMLWMRVEYTRDN
jgi:hypothetical protein